MLAIWIGNDLEQRDVRNTNTPVSIEGGVFSLPSHTAIVHANLLEWCINILLCQTCKALNKFSCFIFSPKMPEVSQCGDGPWPSWRLEIAFVCLCPRSSLFGRRQALAPEQLCFVRRLSWFLSSYFFLAHTSLLTCHWRSSTADLSSLRAPSARSASPLTCCSAIMKDESTGSLFAFISHTWCAQCSYGWAEQHGINMTLWEPRACHLQLSSQGSFHKRHERKRADFNATCPVYPLSIIFISSTRNKIEPTLSENGFSCSFHFYWGDYTIGPLW